MTSKGVITQEWIKGIFRSKAYGRHPKKARGDIQSYFNLCLDVFTMTCDASAMILHDDVSLVLLTNELARFKAWEFELDLNLIDQALELRVSLRGLVREQLVGIARLLLDGACKAGILVLQGRAFSF